MEQNNDTEWKTISDQLDYWAEMDREYWRRRKEQEYRAYLNRKLQKHGAKTMTPYQKWLIKQRIYCEWNNCWKPATKVIKINNRDEVRCDNHGYQPKKDKAWSKN